MSPKTFHHFHYKPVQPQKRLSREVVESPSQKDLKAVWIWHSGTILSGGFCSAASTVGVDMLVIFSDLNDSVNYLLPCQNHCETGVTLV